MRGDMLGEWLPLALADILSAWCGSKRRDILASWGLHALFDREDDAQLDSFVRIVGGEDGTDEKQ